MDIDGGMTEVDILLLNGVAFSLSTCIGGDKINRSLVNYMKKAYSLVIGD